MFREDIIAAGFVLRETPLSVGAAIGSAVHKAVALTLDEKARSGSLAALSAVDDCAAETFRERSAEGVLYDRESPNSNGAIHQSVEMARAYQRTVAPHINPLIVEKRLEANTPFGLVLSGQADLVAHEPGAIRDCKTGKRRGAHAPQIGSYSLLARSHGLDITEAHEDFIRRVPLTKPQPDPVSYAHNVAAAETATLAILRMIAQHLRTFRRGDPVSGVVAGDPWSFPSNPSSVLCSAKFCPAHSCGPNGWCRDYRRDDE